MNDADEYRKARRAAAKKSVGEKEEDPAFEGLKADITQRDQEKRRGERLSQAASKTAKGVKAVGMAASLTPYDVGIGDYLYAGGELLDPEGDSNTAAIAAGAGLATAGIASGALIARTLAAKKALAARKAASVKKAASGSKDIDPKFLIAKDSDVMQSMGKKGLSKTEKGIEAWEKEKKFTPHHGEKMSYVDPAYTKHMEEKRQRLGKQYLEDWGKWEGSAGKFLNFLYAAGMSKKFESYLRKMGIIVDPKESDLLEEEGPTE